ncbi:ogr/Delta-like zinc finger family protein [Enterobacter asburiae]
MFPCPKCGSSTRTRSSDPLSNTVRRSYHQCNNILCSTTFCVLAEVNHIVNQGSLNRDIPPVPLSALHRQGRGDNQIEMSI